MKNLFVRFVALSFAGAFLGLPNAMGQAVGNWPIAGNDAGHSNWQKAERQLSKDTVGQFKFLWKMKLGNGTRDTASFSEPLLAPRLINAQGFKDLVLWADTSTVYAADSELGRMVWQKHYDTPASSACGASNLGILVEPPHIINFGARRAPGAPRPAPAPPTPAGQRRLGAEAGGGGFGLRGVYVLTGDGQLHEQVLTTGTDYAPAVKFLPFPTGISRGLNIEGDVVYTTSKSGCGGASNALWALDMSSSQYPVTKYESAATPLDPMGPTLGGELTYLVTGSGAASGDAHPNSVIGLSGKDLQVKGWYTPASGKLANITPVSFRIKGKLYLAAPGGDGSFVLLDGESLGGADHHTTAAETSSIAKMSSEGWGGMASWEGADGTWVLASIDGPLSSSAKFETSNGSVSHGAIVAFKVEDQGGKTVLTPAWSSEDMIHPAPPVIANGLVIALSEGDAKTHARLYVLDATTGKQLYTSGDQIPTYAHLAGLAFGDSHAFFVTHDGTLYSFGIGMEH